MKVLIISPGKAHDETVAAGIATYEQRLFRVLPISWQLLASGNIESEGKAIEAVLKKDDVVVLLDERGKQMDSVAFANYIEKQKIAGTKRLVFIIGGAFGVSEGIRARAQLVLGLSALVFPHMLVRLILVEQLYRAHSISSGGKYHHV